jgi:carbonic anhydrase/acetyltransferase-like protein (isoleucine patch superfamily)
MNDVWVGDGAVIVPGVTIGTGAVIGANAVVLKDVPPYAVVGGCPAKVLKYRFPEDVISGLLETDWWEFSDEQLKSFPTGNVFQMIDFMNSNKELNPYHFETYRL